MSPQQRYYRRNRKRILAELRAERRADVHGKWRKRRVKIASSHTTNLARIKLAAGCADCGYKVHPAALDFDHRPRTGKRWHVSAMAGRSSVLIQREIAKCDVVCANCHRIRTYKRRRAPGFARKMARKTAVGRRES